MRIVDRKTFLSLPPNTVYSISDWTDKTFSTSITDLLIKGETVAKADYYAQAIPDFDYDNPDDKFEAIEQAVKEGAALKTDFHVESRNAMFDESQMYAIWEKEDIERLIERLKECL
ncbi:hypothetical protein [Klebsiella quasipneumoniae]|uniref:hypothetical protein n=1 Tax=Klebsiella quasipneumoniae TaxID=1463165 RepID=UPI001033334E|nr:hypothetical protein [Klebsiella quasipneumoniae]